MLRATFIGHDASRTGSPIALLRFLGWLGVEQDVSARLLLLRGGPLVRNYEEVVATKVLRAPGILRRRTRRAAAALVAAFGAGEGVIEKRTTARVAALPAGRVFGRPDVVVANSFPSGMALSESLRSTRSGRPRSALRRPPIILHLHEMRSALEQLAAWSDDGGGVSPLELISNVVAMANLVVVPSRLAEADLTDLTRGTAASAVPVRVVPEPVGVGVAVGVLVGVAVDVFVGVAVGVLVGVAVGVLVGVAVGVLVGVTVTVLVFVGVAVGVLVGVGVAVLVTVFVGVAVGVFVGVAVAVLVGGGGDVVPVPVSSAMMSRSRL